MFLRFLRERNPELIDYGVYLLEKGLIEPDTYVLDLDAIEANAHRLAGVAKKCGISLYFMAKQLGHNPAAARRVLSAGFEGMVAVDFREAEILHSAGLPVKHIGHLVQVPHNAWEYILDMHPEVITLFSEEKARELDAAAQKRGIIQDVLLRIWDADDIFYHGQEGGFSLTDLAETVNHLRALGGIHIAGLTSFPCFLYSEQDKKTLPTPNTRTLQRGVEILKNMGIFCSQINMPSCNSLATIPLAASLGATHAEPGHSLTGTNPDNLTETNPLKPTLLYMSEVSHQYENRAYCFGGGYYRRSRLQFAAVKMSTGYVECPVKMPDSESIDYYFELQGNFPVGTPVVMSFRTQIFVTRSRVAAVTGLSRSQPSLSGVWDSQGGKQ